MLRCVAVLPLVLAACALPSPAPPGAWQLLPTGRAASLRGLAVVDADVLWVGGTQGTLLRTTDGGASWHDVAPPDSGACDFRDVEAFDADTALVMVAGQPARVYRTTDGGRSWRIVHEDPRPAAFFDAMAFAGECGVLFGDPIDGSFVVLTSDDRGVSFRQFAGELPAPQAGEAGFAASGTCVAIGPGAAADWDLPRATIVTGGALPRCLLLAPDAGPARAVPLPLASGGASRGAFGLAFAMPSLFGRAADLRAVAVGGDYREPLRSEGTAAFSSDGGLSWHPSEGGAGGYRSAAVWVDANTVLATGSHGTSVSHDGGRTWQVIGEQGFHSVARGRDGSVFAAGSDGRVARWVGPR